MRNIQYWYPLLLLQVWQAIEKVLLEDSMVAATSEETQLTELSPVPQLQLPDTSALYCHNNTQSYDNCKVDIFMWLFLNKTYRRECSETKSTLVVISLDKAGNHP